jgi:uncharacterized protein GlcG (DUF336 family)
MSFLSVRLFTAGLVFGMSSAFAASSSLPAQPLQHSEVSLALAMQLVDGALAACHAKGRTAVAAVVDRGGNLVALLRDDDVGPHNTVAAQRKAYTALSTKSTTSLLAERARNDADSANLNTIDELLLLGGGLPLVADRQVIGAIGVAAAGGASMDEYCAMQAVGQFLPPTN